MKVWYTPLFLAAVGFGLAPACLAGPPFDVDDPGTAEVQHFEINAAYVSSQTRGSESQQFPDVEVNYGYTNTLQLTVGLGAASVRASGTRRHTGLDDTELEAKWRFLEETKDRPQLAFDARLKVPTASRSQGLGSGKADYAPELIAGKSFGRVTLFADAGYSFPGASDEKNNAFYGAAATYQTTERLVLGAQIFGNGPGAAGEKSELAYGLALTNTFAPDRTFLLQVGRSTQGFSDLNVYAGVQFVFGPKTAERK